MTHDQEKPDVTTALSGLGKRIAKVAQLYGGKKALARAIGISESQLYRYIAGDSHPTVQPLAAMAKAGGVDLDWLILGEGAPAGAVGEAAGRWGSGYADIEEYRSPDGRTLDNPPVAALGRFQFNRQWLAEHGFDPARLRLIRAWGDAMAPTIKPGDLLLVDVTQTRFAGDGVYLLRLDGNALCAKRLQYAVGRGLFLVSDNPAYREQHVPDEAKDSLAIVGRVVWHAGTL